MIYVTKVLFFLFHRSFHFHSNKTQSNQKLSDPIRVTLNFVPVASTYALKHVKRMWKCKRSKILLGRNKSGDGHNAETTLRTTLFSVNNIFVFLFILC